MTRSTIIDTLKTWGPQTTEGLMTLTKFTYDRVHNSAKRALAAKKLAKIGKKWATLEQAAARPGALPVPPPASTVAQTAVSTLGTQQEVLKNRFLIVVDNSSSMESVRYETEQALKQTLNTIRSEAFRSGQDTEVSLYYFADETRPATFFRVNAKEMKVDIHYAPYGNTALFDAVMRAINEHKSIPAQPGENVSYVVITLTDGQDNRSYGSGPRPNMYGYAQACQRAAREMNDLIRAVQGTDHWTVTFQVPPRTKANFCSQFTVPQGNVQEWTNDTAGVAEAAMSRDLGTAAFYGARASGATSTRDFYSVTTDLSKLDPNQLKVQCQDVRSQVQVWEVPRETDIQSFVQAQTGRPYQRGTVFYTLSKSEKVQSNKKVLVMEKGHRAVYAGPNARALVGIKPNEDCRVKPGNHSNFDVFVQSTSVNRVLVRGTKLICWPNA